MRGSLERITRVLARSALLSACVLGAAAVVTRARAGEELPPSASTPPATPAAVASPAPPAGSGSPAPSAAPPSVSSETPPGLDQKKHLHADDYARKNQGSYFTGLPLADYDPTTGAGFGARGYYYYDGDRTDPLFALAPYKHRVIVQVFATSRGAQDHLIDYDAPNFLGSLFRVRATAEYEAANIWPYYGIGSRTLAPLSFPGAPGVTFAHLADYQRALQGVQRNGTTYAF